MRVLLSAPYMVPMPERYRAVLEEADIELIEADVVERLEAHELLEYMGEVDGVICGDDRFSRRVLEASVPRLKVISKWGTGVDSIDRDAAKELGVQVHNTPGAFTRPVADSVLGYVLAFARRLPWMDREMKSGGWSKHAGRALHECSLGVIGVGRIGKAVLRRARAFGMTIYGNDIVEIEAGFLESTPVQMTGFENLLARSDFVSLNCDLNPTSYRILDQEALARVKPSCVVINTARGALIDETALIQALREGRLSGAALDVFEDEPLPADSPLREMEQVLLAPHNANASPQAWERVHRNTVRNLLEGLGVEVPQEWEVGGEAG